MSQAKIRTQRATENGATEIGATGTRSDWRFPAEWESCDGVMIAWPHPETDWAPWLNEVEAEFIAMARAILQRGRLLILVASADLQKRAQRLIDPEQSSGEGKLSFQRFDYNDTWLRDTGPISLTNQHGAWRWLDFQSTGYGGKYDSSADDQLIRHLIKSKDFAHNQHQRHEFALEGGGIESDGAGTVMATWTCMSRRHPGKSQAEVAQMILSALASQRMLWVESGELDGDDTDAHIDTLARFVSADCIVYQACDDSKDPHFAGLDAMRLELEGFRQANGQPYRLFGLPWAGAVVSDGRRLASTYANFLLLNGAVLMPTYGVDTDALAASVMTQALPGYEIIGVPCRYLIEQNGSLHCSTMQLPRGTWANA